MARFRLTFSRYRLGLQFGLRAWFALVGALCIFLSIESQAARRQRQLLERVNAVGGSVKFDWEFDSTGYEARDTLGPPRPWWAPRLIDDSFFQKVVKINLCNTAIRNADLALILELADLINKSLTAVELARTSVTGDALYLLRRARHLRSLWLNETSIDDSSLVHLVPLRELTQLHLNQTSLTDGAVVHIGALRCLKIVNIYETQISEAGVRRLQRSSPSLTIGTPQGGFDWGQALPPER